MSDTIKILCKNNNQTIEAKMSSRMSDIYESLGLQLEYGPVGVKVNNKVEGMHYRVFSNKDVEYLDMRSTSGHRAYTRTLFFILCKAVSELYPESEVFIEFPVSNGYFCDMNLGRDLSYDDVNSIRTRMQEIIDAKMPIHRHEMHTEKAIEMFEKQGRTSKARLLRSRETLYSTVYDIDGYYDYYYGPVLTNTSIVYLFGLEKYYDGMLLRLPDTENPGVLGEFIKQDQMYEIFKEYHNWQELLGLRTIGDLNMAIESGATTQLINLSEALQEKKIARIADDIAARRGVRMVLLAGPSSSGKTTTCKRLSIQLLTNGLRPIQISLDDYFVDRVNTPRDEKGDYDYESLYALNLPLLNEQMNALFAGEEVELPRYNFQTGKSEMSGKKLQLKGNEVLVVEGIHALNPELMSQVPQEQIYRVYASALTTILLDSHNYIPTTDNRLLRRIIRDYKYRGVTARDTIKRWPSVRAGENKWIFPYQENADAMFNSAMMFELAVIKQQAEPVLKEVPENCEEYAEARRLLKFLSYIKPINETQIPPTSLLREFLGGSSFTY